VIGPIHVDLFLADVLPFFTLLLTDINVRLERTPRLLHASQVGQLAAFEFLFIILVIFGGLVAEGRL